MFIAFIIPLFMPDICWGIIPFIMLLLPCIVIPGVAYIPVDMGMLEKVLVLFTIIGIVLIPFIDDPVFMTGFFVAAALFVFTFVAFVALPFKKAKEEVLLLFAEVDNAVKWANISCGLAAELFTATVGGGTGANGSDDGGAEAD